MKLDEQATAAAQKAHDAGVLRLRRLFRVNPTVMMVARAPRPRKRSGETKGKRRRRIRNRAHVQRGILRAINKQAQIDGEPTISLKREELGR